MRQYIMRAWKFLLKPFQENLEMMIVLSLYAGSADCFFWTCHSLERAEISHYFGMYMLTHAIIITYGIVLLYGLFSSKLKKYIGWLLCLLGFINLCVDAGVHVIMKCGFIADFVAILMGTNVTETKEFLGMYINGKMLLFIVLISSLAGCVHVLFNKKKITVSSRFAYCSFLLVMACSSIVFLRQSKNWDGVFLMKLVTCSKYKPTPDLHGYSKTYDLSYDGDKPRDLVLIIGESLNNNDSLKF